MGENGYTLRTLLENVLSNNFFIFGFILLVLVIAVAIRVTLGKPEDGYTHHPD
ncbi:MAG: hypothetical protein U0T73_02125 [Chitinophagales bacterium]